MRIWGVLYTRIGTDFVHVDRQKRRSGPSRQPSSRRGDETWEMGELKCRWQIVWLRWDMAWCLMGECTTWRGYRAKTSGLSNKEIMVLQKNCHYSLKMILTCYRHTHMYTCTHTLAALYCNHVEEYKHVQKGLYASTGLYNMLRKW